MEDTTYKWVTGIVITVHTLLIIGSLFFVPILRETVSYVIAGLTVLVMVFFYIRPLYDYIWFQRTMFWGVILISIISLLINGIYFNEGLNNMDVFVPDLIFRIISICTVITSIKTYENYYY